MLGERLGAYRIESELGSGGMGRVYLARVVGEAPGVEVGDRVALKVIHPHLIESEDFFKRFMREAEIGRAVCHPNVVRCYDSDALAKGSALRYFLVMEYVRGQTLRDMLVDLERVPEELCRHIAREVTKGLGAIHDADVVHRDLKPENVLITPDHEVKIMDLGVARVADAAIRLSRTGGFVGSLLYASPEQFRTGGRGVDSRADLFALGVILFELAVGKHPWGGDDYAEIATKVSESTARPLADLNPQVSPFYEEVVRVLLSRDRDRRFPSAPALLEVLEQGERSSWWEKRARRIRDVTRRPLRRIRIPRDTAVYGRERELSKLRTLYGRAAKGEGQVVLVEGEAGIGKSRLVDELVAQLQREDEDLNFLFGTYPPGGAATAAGAWSTAYREHFGEGRLEETLEDYLTATPVLIPAFAALLRGEPTPRGQEPLTAGSVHTPFVHATRKLADERVTVILIEDLHFAPQEGRSLLAAMTPTLPGHRILLIATLRPGLSEEWLANLERMDHVTHMGLDRLGPKDLASLLVDAFGSRRLAEELGFRIATKSDGNPYFVFEIIRSLRERRYLKKKRNGTWVTTKVIEEIQIPSSVRELIRARIVAMSPEERDLLEVAACCGFEFDGRLPAEVLELGRIPALQRLGHIEKTHRLIRASGPRFVFDHHQLREALLDGISEPLREEYHAAIGEVLEQRELGAGGRPEDVHGARAVDLCEHFLLGTKGERALAYLDAALDHLESGHMSDQAIALAGRALLPPGLIDGRRRAKLLLRRAERLDLLGRRVEEEEALEDALVLAETDGDASLIAAATRSLGVLYWALSRHEQAREKLEKARNLAVRAGDRQEEARVVGSQGNVEFSLGRYEEAREFYERYIALSREVGDTAGEGKGRGNLGTVLWSLGRYEEAQEHYELRLAIARDAGDLRGEGRAAGSLGNVYFSLGRHDEAREHYERNLTIAYQVGDRRWEGVATGNLGLVHLTLGQYEEARENYERWVAITQEIGDRRGQASATGNLGAVVWSMGLYDDARRHYEASLQIARDIKDRRGEGIALVDIGPLFSELGDQRAAREALTESLRILREIGARREEAYALSRLGRVAEREGDREAAGRLFEEALAIRREIEYARGVGESLVALGGLRYDEGREGEAKELLAEAKALGPELDASDITVLATCRLALLPGGDPAAARSTLEDAEARLTLAGKLEARYLLWKATNQTLQLREAYGLLRHLRDHAPPEYRDTVMTNVPLHRDILTAWKAQSRA